MVHRVFKNFQSGRIRGEEGIQNEYSIMKVYVQFKRRYGYYLLTLYIPTCLLTIIAYCTLFFNPDDFNSRIVVALTALLVLSSLFTQVMYLSSLFTQENFCNQYQLSGVLRA